jgi:ubiquinone/menaquinone biosynthesis C-methylase UbiE
MWGGADYERAAGQLTSIHDELVARLGPQPGERWLDVATGTGAVALRAARAGAEVTGLDISDSLLEQARAKAEHDRLEIAFELGDAQRLPYDGSSFDVVSSSFGVIFAPDASTAARELGRVVRAGGRLGLTTWCPNEAIAAIYERFQRKKPAADMELWGEPASVRELLGDAFDLSISAGTFRNEAASPEEMWEFSASALPPMKAFLATLDEQRREEYRAAMLEHWARFRTGDGRVSEPRDYLLVLGTRR